MSIIADKSEYKRRVIDTTIETYIEEVVRFVSKVLNGVERL